MQQNPMNVSNVENHLFLPIAFKYIKEFILERNILYLRNIGSPSLKKKKDGFINMKELTVGRTYVCKQYGKPVNYLS